MANGTIHKLGTLYTKNTKRAIPTYPWESGGASHEAPTAGNIFKYYSNGGGNIEIRNTDSNDSYNLRWVEVNDGDKKLLICDRNILTDISWDDLNSQGLVYGKQITIDGKLYKIRLLSGGNNIRDGRDWLTGGTPTTNEWDRIIVNESSFSGLPKPESANLDGSLNSTDRNSAHNKTWNWYYCYSWCQDTTSFNSSLLAARGYTSARFYYYNYSYDRSANYGWRPVLEVLNSAPTINGADGNLGDCALPLVKQYIISDSDNNKLSVVEKLDGTTIKSLDNQNSNTSITLDLTSKWADLSLGTHTVEITVNDGNGASATRKWTFTKVNSAPNKPTMLYPKTNMRAKESFYVKFVVSPDLEGDYQAVKIQVADNNGFSSNLKEFSSGLEKNIEGVWVSHIGNISNADVENEFRISVTAVKNTTKYIRVVTTDQTSGASVYSDYQVVKIGDVLKFETNPKILDFKPLAVSLTDRKNIDSEATIKVFACNNANDEVKTWEEVTNHYAKGEYYNFKNNSKTSDKWAVSVKYVIEANDSINEISVESIGIGVS